MNETRAQADPRLLTWLQEHDVPYDVHEHPLAFTARETAHAEGVPAWTFAKVVGVEIDGGRIALLVLEATDRVDLVKARHALGATSVRLLTEDDLEAIAPGCEVGAMPAVGALYGLPIYADHAVREDPELSFNAGTHRVSVRVDRVAWERAADVAYVDLAEDLERVPAWARS
jgi:Ala-tRNA(Pro) deacylase